MRPSDRQVLFSGGCINQLVMTRSLKSFLKKIFIMVLSVAAFPAFAQNTFTVKLKLVDSNTGDPVGFATASLTVKGENVAAKYVLTDAEGTGTMTKVRKGTYVLKAELMGYKTHEQELVINGNVDLGDIKMSEDIEVLDAASVSAVGNPIVVKKDTVEYTASSFKTSDNDMLEELLKKLPGVEVGTDGSITANGETITKIMIDGKSFFLDDPQLASKNIPAKLIEKVKVVEKKSDQAQFTGIDDGDEEMVIDLSLKSGMKDGWFGNVMGGGGHDIPGKGSDMNDPRFQGAAMIGRFSENSQISIILNGNNTNNRGFNDVAGSMMQGMRGGGMGRGMGGRGRGNGIATSWMGGLNGAFSLFDDDMELASNYLYSGSDRFVEEESSTIRMLTDGVQLHNSEKGTSNTFNQGHRFGVRLEHKFSENTSILFEPQFNFGMGRYSEYSDFSTKRMADDVLSPTNIGFNDNSGNNRYLSTSGFLLLRQRLGKPGRTISANVRYSFSNNVLDGLNQSFTLSDEDYDGEWDTDPEVVNQRIERKTIGTSLSGRVVYTEPLGHDFYLEANYQYSWNRNVSDKLAYNSGNSGDVLTGEVTSLDYVEKGETLDETYSNEIFNRSVSQRGGLNVSYQKEKFRAQLGAAINPTQTYNRTNGEKYESNVINWSPQAMLNYEINDNSHVRVFYFGRSSQPSTSQLMPVPDNSNPLSISLGNPYLEPYFNHNLRAMFGFTDKETFTSVHARFGGSIVENAITNAQWYDQAGIQYSIPVNGPGTGSVNGNVMVNSPFGQSGFSIFSMSTARYNETTSYIGNGTLDSEKYYDAANAAFNYDLFHADFPDMESATDMFSVNRTQSLNVMQRLRLTYRNDFVEITAGGRTRVSKSWFTIAGQQVGATWNNQVEASMNWTLPAGINIISDVDYNWYNGYTTPQEDEVILNAEITKLLFKNKFTLALKAYDILGQSKNLSVTDSGNYHSEVRNNTLGRYIILSLTYRFGNFGAAGGRPGAGGPMRR